MNARRVAVVLASVAGLLGSTVSSADDGGSQVIQATIQVAGGLTLSLRLDDATVAVGERTQAVATATNDTGRVLIAVILTLHLDDEGVSVHGGRQRVIAALQPGSSQTVSWDVCPSASGNYVLMATATALGRRASDAPEAAQSNTVLLSGAGPRARCTGAAN